MIKFREFIDNAISGNLLGMRESFNALVERKLFEALEKKKTELAENLLSKKEQTEENVEEGAAERAVNGMWNQINAHEKAAKATKNPIKKSHYMQMASDLRAKLPSSDDDYKGTQENPK